MLDLFFGLTVDMKISYLGSFIFVVSPFNILPNIKLAILRDWRWRYQKYKTSDWISYEWGFIRLYYWPIDEYIILD